MTSRQQSQWKRNFVSVRSQGSTKTKRVKLRDVTLPKVFHTRFFVPLSVGIRWPFRLYTCSQEGCAKRWCHDTVPGFWCGDALQLPVPGCWMVEWFQVAREPKTWVVDNHSWIDLPSIGWHLCAHPIPPAQHVFLPPPGKHQIFQ